MNPLIGNISRSSIDITKSMNNTTGHINHYQLTPKHIPNTNSLHQQQFQQLPIFYHQQVFQQGYKSGVNFVHAGGPMQTNINNMQTVHRVKSADKIFVEQRKLISEHSASILPTLIMQNNQNTFNKSNIVSNNLPISS
jgi:ribulose bisphosphate carboxylase small subunit